MVPTREVLVLLSLPFIVLARGFFTRLVAMFVQLELRLILLLYPYTQVGMPHHNNIKINNATALDLTRLIDRTSPRKSLDATLGKSASLLYLYFVNNTSTCMT